MPCVSETKSILSEAIPWDAELKESNAGEKGRLEERTEKSKEHESESKDYTFNPNFQTIMVKHSFFPLNRFSHAFFLWL